MPGPPASGIVGPLGLLEGNGGGGRPAPTGRNLPGRCVPSAMSRLLMGPRPRRAEDGRDDPSARVASSLAARAGGSASPRHPLTPGHHTRSRRRGCGRHASSRGRTTSASSWTGASRRCVSLHLLVSCGEPLGGGRARRGESEKRRGRSAHAGRVGSGEGGRCWARGPRNGEWSVSSKVPLTQTRTAHRRQATCTSFRATASLRTTLLGARPRTQRAGP